MFEMSYHVISFNSHKHLDVNNDGNMSTRRCYRIFS